MKRRFKNKYSLGGNSADRIAELIVQNVQKYAEEKEEQAQQFLNAMGDMAEEEAKKYLGNPTETLFTKEKDGYTAKGSQALDANVLTEVDGNKLKVALTGYDAPFVEFGAGVFFNRRGRSFYAARAGMVGIGEYGKGGGKQKYWALDENTYTNGVRKRESLLHADLKLRFNARKIAKEIFGK